MTSSWITEEGWPYPDALDDWIDLESEADDDLLSLRMRPRHLYDDLNPLERQVIAARFGLDGAPVRTMKQLLLDTGLPRADLKGALGTGLAKLRRQLA